MTQSQHTFSIHITVKIMLTLLLILSVMPLYAEAPHQSGFLTTYQGLEKSPDDKNTWRYINPDKKISDYKKVHLEPIGYWLGNQSKTSDYSEQQVQMSREFVASIKSALGDKYEVVDSAGEGVLRMRIAFTGIEVGEKEFQAYEAIPIAAILYGVQKATGSRTNVVEVSIEVEAFDGVSGERVAAAITSAKGDKVEGEKAEVDDIKPVLDFWAKRLRERLDGIEKESVDSDEY